MPLRRTGAGGAAPGQAPRCGGLSCAHVLKLPVSQPKASRGGDEDEDRVGCRRSRFAVSATIARPSRAMVATTGFPRSVRACYRGSDAGVRGVGCAAAGGVAAASRLSWLALAGVLRAGSTHSQSSSQSHPDMSEPTPSGAKVTAPAPGPLAGAAYAGASPDGRPPSVALALPRPVTGRGGVCGPAHPQDCGG